MTCRVVITGMGGVTAFGERWQDVSRRLLAYENAVRTMPEWQIYDGLHTLLGAPIDDFVLPEHYTRKRIRAMGRVSLLSTRATELALEQAGLIDDPVLTNGQTGIAYGSSTGSTGPVSEFATMLTEKHTNNITGTTYVQMMPHTTAVNTGLFFGLRGRVIPTSSACTSALAVSSAGARRSVAISQPLATGRWASIYAFDSLLFQRPSHYQRAAADRSGACRCRHCWRRRYVEQNADQRFSQP